MNRKYEQLLKKYYDTENETEIKILEQKLYSNYGTDKKCFRCGKQLLISDLKEYKYLCLNCNENMYEFEVEN